jgi:lipopolysaccharide export system permease protein
VKRLDRYLIGEILGPFIFGIVAFTAIVSGTSIIFQLVSTAITYGFGLASAIQLFLYNVPAVVSVTLPMAILLATILVMGRLSADLEIVALRSAGVSLYRILMPIFSVGLVVSLINLMFNEVVVPQANYHSEVLINRLKKTNVPIQENVNLTQYDDQRRPLRIINVQKVEDTTVHDITIAEYDSGRLSRIIQADSGYFDSKIIGWVFEQGVMHVLLPDLAQELLVVNFEKEIINLGVNILDFSTVEKSHSEMNTVELDAYIQKESQLGKPVNDLQVQYYLKFALPFACLIFTLLGAAVSFQPHRRSSAMGMGLSIVIILIYYIVYSMGLALGINAVVPPWLAAWLPNLFVGVTSMVLLNRIANQ